MVVFYKDQLFKTVATYFLLGTAAFVFLCPLLWLFFSSFKTADQIFSYPITFLPPSPTFENFKKLFEAKWILKYTVNSTFFASAHTILLLIISTMSGFAFAKYSFRGRRILFGIVLASMMIPFHLVLVPLFSLLHSFGWLDTYQGVILPYLASTGFGVFLMRQFILGIPNELIDAARIDGASEFGIYWRVILPAIKKGKIVISDRFIDSTIAYQCNNNKKLKLFFNKISKLIFGNFLPDLTLPSESRKEW